MASVNDHVSITVPMPAFPLFQICWYVSLPADEVVMIPYPPPEPRALHQCPRVNQNTVRSKVGGVDDDDVCRGSVTHCTSSVTGLQHFDPNLKWFASHSIPPEDVPKMGYNEIIGPTHTLSPGYGHSPRRQFVDSVALENGVADLDRLADFLGLEGSKKMARNQRKNTHTMEMVFSETALKNLYAFYDSDYAAIREMEKYGLIAKGLYNTDSKDSLS